MLVIQQAHVPNVTNKKASYVFSRKNFSSVDPAAPAM